MKRKVIQLAGKTLVVSLPHDWAKKNNIKKGDEIEVSESSDQLILGGKGESKWIKGSVDVSNTHPMIKRILGAHYKVGYDEIDIKFNTAAELETATEVIKEEFIGFEILDHKRNSIKLKKVSNLEFDEFQNMLRRMIFIIKSMAKDSAEALVKKDLEFLNLIALRDKDINKIADFCRRIINKSNKIKTKGPMYFVAEQLEKVGDIFRDLCKYNVNQNVKFSKPLLEIYKEIIAYVTLFENLLFNFNLKTLTEFGKIRYQLRDKISNMYPQVTKEESRNLFFINHALESIFDMNGVCMALYFDKQSL